LRVGDGLSLHVLLQHGEQEVLPDRVLLGIYLLA
jgi:hypothetical protein